MSLADDLKPILDNARAIAGDLGFRPFSVSVRVQDWSGGQAGKGTMVETITPLTVGNGQNVKVEQVSQRDIFLSGGLYQALDLKVTVTAGYSGGGVAIATFDPPVVKGRNVDFKLIGPGLPATGAYFNKIGQDVSSALTYRIYLRSAGTK